MDLQALVSNLGVPIAVMVYLLWQNEKQRQENREDAAKWADAINRNTCVMETLLKRMQADDKGGID